MIHEHISMRVEPMTGGGNLVIWDCFNYHFTYPESREPDYPYELAKLAFYETLDRQGYITYPTTGE